MTPDDNLDARLGALPREVDPGFDAWPGITERMSVRRSLQRTAWGAAAALLVFAAGTLAGNLWASRVRPQLGPMNARLPTPSGPLGLAAEVQRTGTEYLGALSRLQEARDDGEVRQGYEVALATINSAASELAAARIFGATGDSLVAASASARAIASLRVKAIAKESGT